MMRWCSSIIVASACFVASIPLQAAPADVLQPPRVIATDPVKLPTAELLATPEVRTLVGYTRRILHLADQHTLALFSFSDAAPANWLFLLDARDLSVKRFAIPNNDIGSHAAALGSDGNIYLMPYRTGRAYRFDVKTKQFTALKTDTLDLPGSEFTWDAIGGKDGCVYFGTYPNACVGRYEIATGKWTLWKHVAPNTTYVSNFDLTPSGVRFKAWGPAEIWMTCNAQADKPEVETVSTSQSSPSPTIASNLPLGEQSYIRAITVGDRQFAIGFPSGHLYELISGKPPVVLADPQARGEEWFLESADDALIGITHYGITFRYDLKTKKLLRGELPNRAAGSNLIMMLESITPSCVIGGNYSQQLLFRIDPATGKVESSSQMIARMPGEPCCAIGLNGKGYIGTYIYSILSEYDPARPFAFGENPKELAELHSKYQQTRPVAAATDGRLVFISSESDYNHLGGALAVIDPTTPGQLHVDVYAQLIPDQNLTSLAYDTKNKLLWGGTDRWGQMRSAPPSKPGAVIYAFDPASRKLAATLIPWAGADQLTVAGCTDNGQVVATLDARVAIIDGASHQIIFNGTWPIAPTRIRRGLDGQQYFLSGGLLYRWNVTANTLTAVARAPGCTFLTEPSSGLWMLADATSVYRVRLTDTNP